MTRDEVRANYNLPEGVTDAMIDEFIMTQGLKESDVPVLEGWSIPEGATAEQIEQFRNGQMAIQESIRNDQMDKANLQTTVWKALQNSPESYNRYMSQMYDAVTDNPMKMVETFMKIMGGQGLNALDAMGLDVQVTTLGQQQKDMANAFNSYFKDRYGSLKEAKRSFVKDPVGVLGDLSMIFSGGAMGLRGAGLEKTAGVAEFASKVTEPVSATLGAGKVAEKVVGGLGSQTIGRLSGVSPSVLKEAYAVGRAGGERQKTFNKAIAGDIPLEDIVAEARSAIQTIRDNAGRQYRNNKALWSKDSQVLSLEDVYKSLEKSEKLVRYKPKKQTSQYMTTSEKGLKTLNKLKSMVKQYDDLDPAFKDVEGMDQFKQKIYNAMEDLAQSDNAQDKISKKILMDTYHSIKKTIEKQAPAYGTAMKQYNNMQELIFDIDKTLMSGNKTAMDTQFRKLLSAFRDDVNVNFQGRMRSLQKLAEQGGAPTLPSAIAGVSAQSRLPRGIQGATAGIGGAVVGSEFGLPVALGGLTASSPRFGARTAQTLGNLRRPIDIISETTGINPTAKTYQRFGLGLLGEMSQAPSIMDDYNQ